MRTVQFYPLSIINYTSGFIKIKLYRTQISTSIILWLNIWVWKHFMETTRTQLVCDFNWNDVRVQYDYIKV